MKIYKLKKMGTVICMIVLCLIMTTSYSLASEIITNTITVAEKTYQVLELPEDKLERKGFEVTEIEIQSVKVPAWQYVGEDNSTVYQMYLINETGESAVYQYDASEQTLQRVYEDIEGQISLDYSDDLLWDKIEIYFACVVFVILIIITLKIGPVKRPRRMMSKKKAEYIANKVEASYGEYELVLDEESMLQEVGNKKRTQIMDSLQKNTYIPILKSANYNNGSIEVSWESDDGVQGYFVYRKTALSKWKCIKKIYDRTAERYVDNELCQGELYSYTVRSVINYDEEQILSEYDKIGVSEVALMGGVPKTPQLLSVSQKETGIEVIWNLVPMADYYSVYRKENSGKWVKIYETDLGGETVFIDEEVVARVPYEYTVRASKVINKKTYTSEYENPGLKITI